jgi:hypothetical protein
MKQEGAVRIDVGRQLFVDDALISHTTLQRSFHKPRIHPASPVLQPETDIEKNGGVMPCATIASVLYDPQDQLYKAWYMAGYDDGFGYATSKDGITWVRPSLDVVPGTNRVIAPMPGYIRSGATVWLDHDPANRNERFRMFAFWRVGTGSWPRKLPEPVPGQHEIAFVFTSPDGIHWTKRGQAGPCGDNTSFFRNPFRGCGPSASAHSAACWAAGAPITSTPISCRLLHGRRVRTRTGWPPMSATVLIPCFSCGPSSTKWMRPLMKA